MSPSGVPSLSLFSLQSALMIAALWHKAGAGGWVLVIQDMKPDQLPAMVPD